MSTFLSLPPELRHEIYKLVLVKNSGTGPIIDAREAIALKEGSWLWYRNIGGWGLLRGSRLVYEARGVLYQEARFEVQGKGAAGWLRREWVPSIGGNVKWVRSLSIELPGRWARGSMVGSSRRTGRWTLCPWLAPGAKSGERRSVMSRGRRSGCYSSVWFRECLR